MKIVVLGADGMLGHKMFQVLDSYFDDVAFIIRGSTDSTKFFTSMKNGFIHINLNEMEHLFFLINPDIIINCIGLIKQREESKNVLESIEVNARFPHILDRFARINNKKVIHFSTDCIFDGVRGSYTEEDPYNPVDIYGLTKALGEVRDSDHTLTLRTSFIGRELKGFTSLLEWVLSKKGETIGGYTNVWYSGVTTNYIANLVQDIVINHPNLSGLCQIVGEKITKHDLLQKLNVAYDLNMTIIPVDVPTIDRSMLRGKYMDILGWETPTWDDMIQELVEDSTPYEEYKL